MLTDIEMMTISNLDFLHYMTAVSHEMSDEPKISGKGTWTRNPYVFVYEFELLERGGEE